MADGHLPHPRGMTSFWLKEQGDLQCYQSTSELPPKADIVIIGAGFSGGSLVTHLTSHGVPAQSILVLEARNLCSGATGRNGGHLKPDSYNQISDYAKKHGIDAAAEVANFEVANVLAVQDYITSEKVDCDFVLTRAVDVQFNEEQHRKLKSGHRLLATANVEATKRTYCAPDDRAETLSGVKGAKGMFSYVAGHCYPYKLIHHMFSKAVQKGVQLHTNTPVNSIPSETDLDGLWALETPRGTIRAKKVIVATNAYTSALLPEYKDKIVPVRGICCHIDTPGKPPYLPNTYALRFSEDDFDYLIPRIDGSIIVGGARSAFLKDPAQWYGNADDSSLIEQARHYFDGYMQRHFQGWESSDAYVTDIWTGIMGYSSDRAPHVGPVPRRPDMFMMSGFTGHGMPQVFLCAKGIAKMVTSKSPFSDTGVPRLFETSQRRLSSVSNLIRPKESSEIAPKL